MNKLCLGTVQFGMQYGINNSLGRQPNIEECFEILDCAVKHGINCFDTASGYGNAEEILGEYKNWDKNKIDIISKIKPLQTNIQKINSYVLNECESSLNKIGIDRFFGYLFHSAEDMYNKELCNALKQCKIEGLAQNVGVSIYSPEDALYAAQLEFIDFIQIPYNVLDQRLNKNNFFNIANKNNKKIFARSAFLQGLLLMDIIDVKIKLPQAEKYVKEFEEICRKYNFSRKEAAFLFSYINANIDYVVFGVDTKKQLENNICIIKKMKEFKLCYDELTKTFINAEIKEEILNPSMWHK